MKHTKDDTLSEDTVETSANTKLHVDREFAAFLAAVDTGEKETIQNLLDQTEQSVLNKWVLQTARIGNLTILTMLHDNTADLNHVDDNGKNALLIATEHGHKNIVRYCLRHKISKKTVDHQGNNVLHYACKTENEKLLPYFLLKKKLISKINTANKKGETPLHIALANGRETQFKLLLANNADTSLVDHQNNSLLHFAAIGGCKQLIEYIFNDLLNKSLRKVQQTSMSPSVKKHFEEMGGTHSWDTLNKGIKKTIKIAIIDVKNKLGQTPLMLAAKNGHTEVMKFLIEHGANIDAIDNDGLTCLQNAINSDSAEIISYIISQGGKIDTIDKLGRTLLHHAAANNSSELIEQLLNQSFDIEAKDTYGNSPLHLAAQDGKIDAIETLLKHKANIEARNKSGNYTPLHLATYYGHTKAVELLLTKQADLEAEDLWKNTPLSLAEKFKHKDIMIILLKCHLARNTTFQTNKRTSMHWAASKGYIKSLKYLIKQETDLETKDLSGYTPLHLAAMNGQVKTLELLMLRGAHIDTTDNKRKSPLHSAAEHQHTEILETLLNHGADINAVDENGFTPLHVAVEAGKIAAAARLIELESDMNKKDKYGNTPLDLAEKNQNQDMIKIVLYYMLIKSFPTVKGKWRELFHWAVAQGRTTSVDLLLKQAYNEDQSRRSPSNAHYEGLSDALKKLLAYHVDVDAKDSSACTPLRIAAVVGNIDITNLLLKYGANIEAEDSKGLTPLYHAVKWKHIEIVKILLRHNASILSSNEFDKYCPLYKAAYDGQAEILKLLLSELTWLDAYSDDLLSIVVKNGHTEALKILLKYKPDINDSDDQHIKLLHFAAAAGYANITSLLIEHNADIEAKDSNGRTPLHLAAINKRVNAINTLLSFHANIQAIDNDGMTALNLAAVHGDIETLTTLLEQDQSLATIDMKNNMYKTPLLRLAQDGRTEALKVLLKYNPNINATDVDHNTALHIMIRNRHIDSLKILMNYKPDIEIKNINDNTPLHFAAAHSQYEATKILLKNQANVNAINYDGFSPLHIAAKKGKLELVKLLMHYGADEKIRDQSNKTPIKLATENGFNSLADYIKNYHVEQLTKQLHEAKKEIEILKNNQELLMKSLLLLSSKQKDAKNFPDLSQLTFFAKSKTEESAQEASSNEKKSYTIKKPT